MKTDYTYLLVEYYTRFSSFDYGKNDAVCVSSAAVCVDDFYAFLYSFENDYHAIDYMMSHLRDNRFFVDHLSWLCMKKAPVWLIEKYRDCWDWSVISFHHIKTKSFVRHFHDKIDWEGLETDGKFLFSELVICQDYINWKRYCRNHIIKTRFLRKFKDRIDWREYCENQAAYIGEKIAFEFHDKIVWRYVATMMSRQFIKKHHDLIDWDDVARYGMFTEYFYDQNQQYLKKELVNKNPHINFRVD